MIMRGLLFLLLIIVTGFIYLCRLHQTDNPKDFKQNKPEGIRLSFSLLPKEKSLLVKIENTTNHLLVLDGKAISDIALMYWFDVAGVLHDSGYTASAVDIRLLKEDFYNKHYAARFINLAPHGIYLSKISLTSIFETFNKYFTEMNKNDMISFQICGKGLACATLIEHEPVFDDTLAEMLSMGEPLGVSAKDLNLIINSR